MEVPESHPRYHSLKRRDKLVEAWKNGIVGDVGLIAHGRGEAYDYLLGEETIPPAKEAERIAAALILNAERPVISVNGNTAALAGEEIAELQKLTGAVVEVNLFYRTEERAGKVADNLRELGIEDVLGENPDKKIPGLDHARANACSGGIFNADVVLVPLEDGDRTQALVDMGKTVIAIDLNPLSRTSKFASLTIVDEVSRAVSGINAFAEELKGDEKRINALIETPDNKKILRHSLMYIQKYLGENFS